MKQMKHNPLWLLTYGLLTLCTPQMYAQQINTPDTTVIEGVTIAADRQLEQVTVTASNVHQRAGRQIIFPTSSQVKFSANGYDLLNRMMLNRLQVDPVMKTLSVSGGGKVQARINGIKASSTEVAALQPKDVLRVEYHEFPGARYGDEGMEAVVDFIVRRTQTGLRLFGNGTTAPFSGLHDVTLGAKFNCKQSQFGITYAYNTWNYKGNRHTEEETLYVPDATPVKRTFLGEDSPLITHVHNLSFSYNLFSPDKYVLNVLLTHWKYNEPKSDDAGNMSYVQGETPARIRMHSSEYQWRPSGDIYFQKFLPHNQSIVVNAVGTYFDTDFTRHYLETQLSDTLSNLHTLTDGSKYSLITEAFYEKQGKRLSFTTGIKHTQSYTTSHYNVNTRLSDSDMTLADTYLYAEIQGKPSGKFSYTAGVGASRFRFDESGRNYTFYTFRPVVSLLYKPAATSSLQYNFRIVPTVPELASLNAVSIPRDQYWLQQGNPTLKPYRSYVNTLAFTFRKGLFTLNATGKYTCHQHPIMQSTFYDKNYFVRREENQRNLQNLNGELNLKVGPINNMLVIDGTGSIYRYISNGLDYTHRYTSYRYQFRLTAFYKHWAFMAVFRNGQRSLWGETVTDDGNYQMGILNYSHKNFSIAALILYPFTHTYKDGSKNLSRIAPVESWRYIRESGRMFLMKFSYNFSFGQKYKSKERRLKNKDEESGILK